MTAAATAKQISQNQQYAALLGWTPTDFGATAFDDLLVSMIEAEQTLFKLSVDGVAGPMTYGALLEQRAISLASSKSLADCGLVALWHAKSKWCQNIVDVAPWTSKSRDAIDEMIRTKVGINWTWEPYYSGNFEWCGAFAAYAWAAAKLSMSSRYSFFSSTLRLDRWARYQSIDASTPNLKPSKGPYRIIIELDENSRTAQMPDGSSPRAGDILMVGPCESAYGKHITVIESFDAASGLFTTIEGNGTGMGPGGVRQHGVVRASRPLGLLGGPRTTYHARRIIRPAPSDCGIFG